jgi:hypothetical protein
MGAMKRILHTFVEFAEEGMPAALHVNGRTDHDFDRWIECISKRPEITHIAYEFTTRSGAISRRPHHVAWLARIAQSISRPLHLIVAGRTDVLSKLAEVFPDRMSILETTSFMKALHRRAAVPMGNDVIAWKSAPTNPGQSVHHILAHNFDVRQSYLRMLASASLRTNS